MGKTFAFLTRGAGVFLLALALILAPSSYANHGPDDVLDDGTGLGSSGLHRSDPSAELADLDLALAGVVSSGPSAKVTKNLAVAGRGARLAPNSTTDVYALNGFAYIGTFNSPCGDGTGANGSGVRVFDVTNKNKVKPAGFLPSVAGSRINDIKVANMNSGAILVHSNEQCAGGPGGFEVYNVDNPTNAAHLAHVQVDEINPISNALFGGLSDNGVHNLFLFTQGNKDYVAAQSEGAFDGFQIFDISDPENPSLVSGWGAEEVFDPGVGDLTNLSDPAQVNRVLNAALWLLDGFGASANRFLHDFTITSDGSKAYLAHWDAGLILLDISDVSNPQPVSVALDVANGSPGDGEVNSHSVWPSEDGKIVVEGEEDFSAWEATRPPTSLTLQNLNTIPAVAVSTTAGTAFEGSQTGNSGTVTATSVSVTSGPLAGQAFPAVEFVGNNVPLGNESVTGNFVWVGRACNGDPFVNALSPGEIAVVLRGTCFFSDKAANVAAAGASAMVLANNNPTSTPWSGLRIWDYSDPANPVLASTFDTICSASTSPGATCDPGGTYSSHNVIVETTDDGHVRAYISWYSDGVVVIDVTDPYNPVEVGRYHEAGTAFETANGGIQDVWGVHKIAGEPWIYASDRNGGLYVLKEYGSGSKK